MIKLNEKRILIRDVKDFAINELGIKRNRSFERVVKYSTLYSVAISKSNKIESVIEDNYKFFRSKKKCYAYVEKMKSEKVHVFVTEFDGWNSKTCPITQDLLRAPKYYIADTVFHENMHLHYPEIQGKFGLDIYEALASVFAYQASLEFFNQNNKRMLRHIQNDLNKSLCLADFINAYYNRLKKAYENNPKRAQAILHEATIRIDELYPGLYSEVNNAFFLDIGVHFTKLKPVLKVLKNINPRDYVGNQDLLHKKLEEVV